MLWTFLPLVQAVAEVPEHSLAETGAQPVDRDDLPVLTRQVPQLELSMKVYVEIRFAVDTEDYDGVASLTDANDLVRGMLTGAGFSEKVTISVSNTSPEARIALGLAGSLESVAQALWG